MWSTTMNGIREYSAALKPESMTQSTQACRSVHVRWIGVQSATWCAELIATHIADVGGRTRATFREKENLAAKLIEQSCRIVEATVLEF